MLALMHDEIEIEPRLGLLEGDCRDLEGSATVVERPPRLPP
jgi:hypothetical protein